MGAPLLDRDPRQLGGYWLAARLGAGGQGVVYEGYDAQGDRVAVKALHADALTDRLRDGMRREVATLQRIASFCTARIIAADLDHVPPYIVSEYVPGPDLHHWVEEHGAYGPDELYRLAIGIATALASIHRAGVIHRDLKPANVLIGPDGPRVIDFGIARTDEMSRSATGLKGTPRWMAPELFRGGQATPAVDVWAWGAIVLFAADGVPPFDGGTLPVLMHQITTKNPDTGRLREPLRGLVEAALSQDPAARPAPGDILAGLVGGEPRNPLEAGRAAAETTRPPTPLPPSLADIAERVHNGLDPEARQAVPRILLRMIVARPGADDVLCTVPIKEFEDGETGHFTVERVLRAFSDAGLLRITGGVAAITTPALLRAWPRLRDWVEAERAGLDGHHALAGAARRWNAHGRKTADLLQGSSLDDALGWASTGRRRLTLNLAERDLIAASVAQTRVRARTRTVVAAALAVLLLIATGAGVAAGFQSLNLSKANATVSAQRDAAVGRQLAAQAVQSRRTDPALARRLAVAAESLAPGNADTHHALVTLSSQWERDIWTPPGIDGSWNRAYPQNGGPLVFFKREQNRAVIVDPEARRIVRTINLPGAQLAGLDLTLDGKRLFTLQQDGTQTFWDVARGTPSPLPYKHRAGAGLHLSPTGAKLVTTYRGDITVVEAATGRTLFRAKGDSSVWSPAMPPDERFMVLPLAAGKNRTRLAWWDLTTGKEVSGDHDARGRYPFDGARQFVGTTFSPDGRFLATRAGDVIVVLDARTRKVRTTLSAPKDMQDTSLDFSRDGGYIATDTTLWSTEPGTQEQPYLRYRPDAMCSGTRFDAAGTTLRCVDGEARVRSLDVSSFTRPLRFAPLSVKTAISPDGSTLAVRVPTLGVDPDTLQIWDARTRTKRSDLRIGHPVGREMALSPGGRFLALPDESGAIEVWDVRSGARRTVIQTGSAPSLRPLPSFSPDGRAVAVVVSTRPAVLAFYDSANGRKLGEARTKQPSTLSVDSETQIVWSKDGKRVVSALDLGVVAFPSGRTVVEPGALNAPAAIRSVQALSPQGVLATVEGSVEQRSLRFWDVATLRQRGGPIRLPKGPSPITAISPDGRLAATADVRGKVDLWDVGTGRRLGLPLTGHTATTNSTDVQSLAFSPDGTRLFSVGQDDAKLVTHTVAPHLLKKDLCSRTGGLSRAEWDRLVGNGVPYRTTC